MRPGDVISYVEMCNNEGATLQRGMNFKLKGGLSIILMSLRTGAPYADRVEEAGKILVYEGHDVPRSKRIPNPKLVDQSRMTPLGTLTQNGLFYEAVQSYIENKSAPELVKVYEKIKPGIWVYNGLFILSDVWQEEANSRKVFKFKLELIEELEYETIKSPDIDHNRLVPSPVKLEVWKRDKGKCVICGKQDNLHFDHIIPYSKGGSSLVADNIQILCARHNLAKKDKIE